MNGKDQYKYIGHGPWYSLGGKKVCWSCGLVALNNKASDWCVDKGCDYKLHSGYTNAMKRLAGFKMPK